MKHTPFHISTTEALQRVFLPAIPPLQLPRRPFPCPSLHPLNLTTNRHASTRPQSGAFDLAGKFVPSSKFGPKPTRDNTPTRPQNEAISAQNGIHLVLPNSQLSPLQSLSTTLRTLDHKTHFLEQHDTIDGIPVCKIISKAEARAAEKERRKARQKNPALTTKYLELNWAIDRNDLDHRLGKLRQFLEEGRRVEVLLLKKKKRMRDATEAEGRMTLERVRECVGGVEGAREMRAMGGEFLGRATLFYEGRKVRGRGEEGGGEGKEQEGGETEERVEQEDVVEEEQAPRQAAYG